MQIIDVSAAFVFRYQSNPIMQNNILQLFQLDAASLRSELFISLQQMKKAVAVFHSLAFIAQI